MATKYRFINEKSGEYVQRLRLANDNGNNHLGIDFTKDPDKALTLAAVAYEPNQVRLKELLTSLTDATYRTEMITDEHNG